MKTSHDAPSAKAIPMAIAACAVAVWLSACGSGGSSDASALGDTTTASTDTTTTTGNDGSTGGSTGSGSTGGSSGGSSGGGSDQPGEGTGGGGGDGSDPRDDDSELGGGDANLPGEIRFEDAPAQLPIVGELPGDGNGGYLCADVRFVGDRNSVIRGTVRVPEGKTCVIDTAILSWGSRIEVARDASLYARKLWMLWGSVTTTEADRVLVESSVVIGNIVATNGGRTTVRRNYVWDIRLGSHEAAVFVLGNRVWDDIELHGNLGGTWLLNNRVGDMIDCSGNANPISGSGNSIVNPQPTGMLGQCVGMGS